MCAIVLDGDRITVSCRFEMCQWKIEVDLNSLIHLTWQSVGQCQSVLCTLFLRYFIKIKLPDAAERIKMLYFSTSQKTLMFIIKKKMEDSK